MENDSFLPLVRSRTILWTGTFQGISVHSGGDISTQSRKRDRCSTAMSLEFANTCTKADSNTGRSSSSRIHHHQRHSRHGRRCRLQRRTYLSAGSWERSWSKIEDCSNNLFLWLSDQPISSSVPLPPACFTVLTGAEARAEWARAKQNWIDCHPNVARTPNDPVSNPEQCVANSFGGYSRDTTETCDQECH